MATNGVSTRKVKRVARTMGIDRMSASQVSRICSSLDESVADLRERDLSDVVYPYIWLEATHIKCRDAGRRRFGDDSIGRAAEGAKVNEPAHADKRTATEHAARIIALVVADNPIPGRKAA